MKYDEINVSLVIPTYRRADVLKQTLLNIQLCKPVPAEILVHIDAGDNLTSPMLRDHFPGVRILESETRKGPGGARNLLIAAASHQCVVSLDDDSWPLDTSFFFLANKLVESEENAAVFACRILESDETNDEPAPGSRATRTLNTKSSCCFVGCGSIYRSTAFSDTQGYLPLQEAYGMEEVDLSLQLLDIGWEIRSVPELYVYHHCNRMEHHADTRINAAQIRNTALLAFIRYPVSQWPRGAAQTANRIFYSIKQNRIRGVLTGILSIPSAFWRHRRDRSPVSRDTVQRFLKERA